MSEVIIDILSFDQIRKEDHKSLVSQWARIYLEALAEENSFLPNSMNRQIDPTKLSEIQAQLESLLSLGPEEVVVYLALVDHKILGYFLGLVKYSPAEVPDKTGYINGLFVSKENRGKGLAQALLDKAHQAFGRMGIEQVELYLTLHNIVARNFWIKNGYIKTQEVLMKNLENCPLSNGERA